MSHSQCEAMNKGGYIRCRNTNLNSILTREESSTGEIGYFCPTHISSNFDRKCTDPFCGNFPLLSDEYACVSHSLEYSFSKYDSCKYRNRKGKLCNKNCQKNICHNHKRRKKSFSKH